MSLRFSRTGIEVDTFEEIFDRKVEQYKEIYGEDINLEQDTTDGQRVGIESNSILDMQSFLGWLYTQIDPDFSQGEMLNTIAKICGITRKPSSRSTCDVVITSNIAAVLPLGWSARDVRENLWITTAEVNLVAGDNTITLSAQYFGAVEAQIGDISEANDVVLGITAVNNLIAATVGVDEETDEEFRIRRNASVENPARSSVGELQAGLLNTEGVTSVKIYENIGTATDTDLDLPAHSIWIIADGGLIGDISKTITLSKTLGCGEKGSVTGLYVEELGSGLTVTHQPRFDRPRRTNVTLTLSVRSKTSSTVDATLIQAALLRLKFGIAESIDITELYSSIYESHTNIVASLLTANKGDGVVTDNLESGYDEILVIGAVEITVL